MAKSNKWRVYIQPFDDFGNYTGTWTEVTDYVELDSLGSIDRSLDNTDYNIGIYRNSDFQMTLRNDDGRFSDVGGPTSMFKWTRSNSLVKITWTGEEVADTNGIVCGFFEAGNTLLLSETEVFRGLLSDKALTMDLNQQELQFTILGLETIFTNVAVNFTDIFGLGDLGDASTAFVIGSPGWINVGPAVGMFAGPFISTALQFQIASGGTLPNEITGSTYTVPAGSSSGTTNSTTYFVVGERSSGGSFQIQVSNSLGGSALGFTGSPSGAATFTQLDLKSTITVSSIISTILNQAAITKLITIGSISVGQDAVVDDWSDLEGKTVWDALSDLLLISNSVLSINGSTLTVSPRTASASLKYTFYGQGSILGAENIQDIKNIASGIARTFNYFSWPASSQLIPITTNANVTVQNPDSIAKFGANAKEFSFKYIVDAGTVNARSVLLTSLLSEFGVPKQEFDLYTPIASDTLPLTLLDKIAVDYPVVNTAVPGQQVPICGEAVCGESYLPSYSNYSFFEAPSTFYKIEGVSIDPQTDLICFSMRRV